MRKDKLKNLHTEKQMRMYSCLVVFFLIEIVCCVNIRSANIHFYMDDVAEGSFPTTGQQEQGQ